VSLPLAVAERWLLGYVSAGGAVGYDCSDFGRGFRS
jgi:hypothetical protein